MANNPNTQITMTNREKWSLEAKAKQGWKCYFIEREHIYELQEVRNNLRAQVHQLRTATSAPQDYEHLKKMFLDLYDKVGEMCDCPVCMEPMTKDNTAVPLCGHLICKECKEKVVECPICRKKY
jgi:hypothetical protein